MMRPLSAWCALLLLAESRAPAQIRITTALSPGAIDTTRTFLRESLPAVPVELTRVAAIDVGTDLEPPGVDLYWGVDAEVLAAQARAGRLRPYASPAAGRLSPLWREPQNRVLVPICMPWVIAFRADRVEASEVPDRWDGLLLPAFAGRLVLCDPIGAPSLWVQWLQSRLRHGFTEQQAFAWLTALDARVAGYLDSPEATRDALLAGRGDLAALPLSLARSANTGSVRLDHVVPAADLPVTGLGLALVAGAPHEAEAPRVYDSLLAVELARRLASRHDLLPCDRTDLPPSELPDHVRRVRPAALPCRPEPGRSDRWFAIWEERVRGRGRGAETVLDVLDIVLGVALLIILCLVYIRSRKAWP